MERLCSSKMWEVGAMCNGVLAGLVSISAGCATVTSLASLWIGIFGGVIFFCASKFLLHKCKIDDPLDAIAVHGVCGCCELPCLSCTPPHQFDELALPP